MWGPTKNPQKNKIFWGGRGGGVKKGLIEREFLIWRSVQCADGFSIRRLSEKTRVVATALGASVGAAEANYFGANLAAFMLAIFFIGLLSFGFRLEKTAYRYASVTLTIIVLIPRTNPAWIVALHRFIEVSVGIIVALAVVAFWPERSAIAADE